MSLLVAAVLFALYLGNVAAGAFWRSPVVSDVYEMIILFAASIAFVVAILGREARAKSKK